MTAPALLISADGPLTRITINRPAARNALNHQLITALAAAFRAIPEDGSVRAVLLRGAGDESFCAGADLSELRANSSKETRAAFFLGVADLMAAIMECAVPVVAQVYGFALAGGCGVVAAADIVLAADDAVFGLPEVAVGLAALSIAAPLERAIGYRALSELALTGERISAHRAHQIGLITRVVPPAELEATATAVCETLCSRSPAALRACKRALMTLTPQCSSATLAQLATASAELSLGSEAQEGIAAFCEKRAPSWKQHH
jgi:methylglutaconyl-CoA hydratase